MYINCLSEITRKVPQHFSCTYKENKNTNINTVLIDTKNILDKEVLVDLTLGSQIN